ncbi:MAG: YncE family protein [Betaproteobacteria bacterium]|nr:YncE family protein [Betaproteobacteria bacterium]
MSLRLISWLAALGLAAATLAAYSAPRLIVLNKSDHTLAVVDPVTLKVLGKVPTGEGPHEAAITADGKFAVVANYGAMKPGNTLSVIDIDTLKEKERVDLGALTRPHGIQWVKDKVYFTSETTRSVARFDPASSKIDWLMGTGASASHMLVVSADGRKLYTSNIASNNVTAIRLDGPANAQGIAQIAVGAQPEAIDISPDGREVWVGHNGDGGVSIIDAATNAVSATMKVGSLPIRLKFSPDGKWVFVSDPRGGGAK